MIDTGAPRTLWVRLLFPWAWRDEGRIAAKLDEFSRTEHGSALDMLRAAERVEDPRLTRLYFRHALDEARHARRFAGAAKAIVDVPVQRRYAAAHGLRQNLYDRYSELEFLEFVHQAEGRGAAQFAELARRFEDHPELSRLFAEIEKDERFHVAYSGRYLKLRRGRKGSARALLAHLKIRSEALIGASRRTGRRVADAIATATLGFVYCTILVPFVLMERMTEGRDRPRWVGPGENGEQP